MYILYNENLLWFSGFQSRFPSHEVIVAFHILKMSDPKTKNDMWFFQTLFCFHTYRQNLSKLSTLLSVSTIYSIWEGLSSVFLSLKISGLSSLLFLWNVPPPSWESSLMHSITEWQGIFLSHSQIMQSYLQIAYMWEFSLLLSMEFIWIFNLALNELTFASQLQITGS